MNKNTDATIWTVSTWGGWSGGGKPTLVSASVKKTARQVTILEYKNRNHWGFRKVIPIGQVHFSAEDAIAAWKRECQEAVEQAQQELAEAIALRDMPVEGTP